MMGFDAGFFRELCLTPAPSGFESPVRDVLRTRMAGVADVQGDPLGNSWAEVNPEGSPHLAVVAHADQIGLIVTLVDERGFIRFDAIGWVDQQLLPGHLLRIHAKGGPVDGVVCRPPTHIIPEAERGKALPIKEQVLDIGASSREEAVSRVSIGDPITFMPSFTELAPGRYATLAVDNRAGVYAAFHGLELYEAESGGARFTAVATAHEETTYMGAKALGHRLDADCVVVVDGDFASDYPGVDSCKLGGEILMGGGPVLGRGTTTNAALFEIAREAAEAEGIPIQIKAYAGEILTDAQELAAAGSAALLSVSIPMRYVHTPAEVVCADDIENTARLMAALARRVAGMDAPGCFVS